MHIILKIVIGVTMEKTRRYKDTYTRIILLPFECKHRGTTNQVRIPFELTEIEVKKVQEAKKEIKINNNIFRGN